MTKRCWATSLCLLTASTALCLLTASTALAQAPRGRNADADFGDEAAGEERGARGERGERGGREFGRDGEEGRGGPGGPGRGGMFRRSNAMFEAIDADGDGSISNTELRKAAAALKKLDADGDGQITLAEVGGGPGGPGGFGPGGPGGGDMTQFVDQVMTQDKNGDGKLSLNEVDERTAMMLSRADANGDKAIDRAELTTAMEQMRQRMGGGFGGGGPGGPGAGGFGRGGGDMTERMMSFDKNGDGQLSPDEVPEQARGALRGADANGDGKIDASELEQASRRMGGRARGVGAGAAPGGAGRFDRGGEDEADGAEANRRSRRGRDADDE